MTVDLGGGAWIMNKYIDCFRIISKCEKKDPAVNDFSRQYYL